MDLKLFFTVFGTVLVAELGDKTQLATLLFAAQPGASRIGVFAAAAGALVLAAALGVLAGGWVGQHVPERALRYVAGAGFVAIGLWTLVRG